MSLPLPVWLANGVVRAWTRLYTWRAPPELRDARREEIESDLWEAAHDPASEGRFSLPVRIFVRLLIGIPDDLGWRVEQVSTMNRSSMLRVALTVGGAGVLALWIAISSLPAPLATLPDAPRFPRRAALPPPPPPPPPVRSPFGSRAADLPFTYGRASYTVVGNLTPPVKMKDVRPVYPPIAVSADVQGVVVVGALIGKDGRVLEARIVESVPMLDQSAIDAVRQWEFEPTKVNGAPIQVTIMVRVRFAPTA